MTLNVPWILEDRGEEAFGQLCDEFADILHSEGHAVTKENILLRLNQTVAQLRSTQSQAPQVSAPTKSTSTQSSATTQAAGRQAPKEPALGNAAAQESAGGERKLSHEERRRRLRSQFDGE